YPAQQGYPVQQGYPAQYPGYGPSYGYPPVAGPPTNTLAVVSLITGIAGLTIFPFLASIAAVITGHMARRRIQETGEAGQGLTTAGLVLGYIGIGIVALVILGFLVLGVFAASVSSSMGTP
ncbi:MAG TPA: DUF4190 domain-containing protein, partial [Actinotalea sp.]